MASSKEIWVIPELSGPIEEIGKSSLGLLNEARDIAGKVNGSVTAIVLGDTGEGYTDTLRQYMVTKSRVFKHALLKTASAELIAAALTEKIHQDKPWLLLMGNTVIGKELAPLLAVTMETGW